MPKGLILIFCENGVLVLKKFDGSAWEALRTLTEEEAARISY